MSDRARPLLYAHRGAAAEQPENTLPAFRRALELGADALEMDLHMSADGEIVVSHDPTGLRMAGVARAIAEAPVAEVQRWDAGWGYVGQGGERPFAGQGYRVPTFAEVLAEFSGVPLNVDVKQRRPDMVPALLEVLRQAGAEERVLVASFHADVLARVRRRYPGRVGLGRGDVRDLLVLPRPLLRRRFRAGDAAQLPTRVGRLSLARSWIVAKAHDLGLRVDYWTVNDPVQAAALLTLGADGVMTDDPARVAPAFAAARVA